MTQNSLFLRRLVILTHEGKTAYDETFHRGVNIIRGQNSSGKSTIIRFIFYVLGGSYSDFVPEALRCQSVVAEVEIGGHVITLKRDLERADDGRVKKNASMYIYYGSIEEYKSDKHPARWQKYGYNTSEGRRSFSNVLFEVMGLPELRADSNITMHQILRLIYLDQESPLSSLFLFDLFDKEITRETTAELLMGLYDEKLSQAKLKQIALTRRMDELRQSIRITRELLTNPTQQSPDFLRSQIAQFNREIEQITLQVQSLRNKDSKMAVANKKLEFEYQRMQQQVASLRRQLTTEEDAAARLKADIQDSLYFIAALQKKIEAVDRSIATREYFDTVHLEYCPECLSKIDESVEEGHCRLCKSPIDNSRGKSQALRIKLELQFQIRESQSLLKVNQDQLHKRQATVKRLKADLAVAQQQFDNAVQHIRSSHDEQIDQLIQDKGYKEGEIVQYQTMLEHAEQYEGMINEQNRLKEQSEQLARYIKAAELNIQAQRNVIKRHIRENGIYLLQHDEDRQAEFRNARDMDLDFAQNIVYLTDRHIKLSASSSFYLKLAARFAFFLSSVQVESMCYPRLLFSDNMEDKGMEEDRSRNFQRIVVQRLKEIGNPDYQVIFATSNIAQELDIPEYTIGEFYTQENKSLKNV